MWTENGNFNIRKEREGNLEPRDQEGDHGYHYKAVQNLLPGDYPLRLQFCRSFQELDDGDNTLNKILSTDEFMFTKDGSFNYHNEHYYSKENPRQKRVIIGPYFFKQSLNGDRYKSFLDLDLPILIRNAGKDPDNIIFLHDGAPPHSSRGIRDFLNEKYPLSRIERAADNDLNLFK
uniref:Tc1-like transposase DDE domain-containing protein n=1 Tax=Megaselia scalaris TaxID=36166 RepID=T1H1K0_MEGSC